MYQLLLSFNYLFFRVGVKDKGSRFLSFVDTMNGYRHLLTPEDINKAASLCTSLRGVLKSRFMVLSDDHTPPPPPNARGKRKNPDDEVDEPAKRFQAGQGPPNAQCQTVVEINDVPSTPPYQTVTNKSSRRRGLPAGVVSLTNPARVTPDRAAKVSKSAKSKESARIPHAPDVEAIEVDLSTAPDAEGMSQDESISDEDSGSSSKTVVDWVSNYSIYL